MSELLAVAVAALGGSERPGQARMAEAVREAIETDEHVAVQAGTGTGKSLAYLVPAIRHAVAAETTVVVSTATIALQRQLVDRDLPRLAEALTGPLGRAPTFAILKGRRNYLCRYKLTTGASDDDEPALFDPRSVSSLGRQVARLHEWAEETTTGDRDELVPGVSELAWRQVSVSARECLGAGRCPSGGECFAEQAREDAGHVDVVVTNHALLAIDAMESFPLLPEHDVIVVDEAHDLVDRVTSVATGQLSEALVAAAARRAGRACDQEVADRLAEAGEGLGLIMADTEPARLDHLSEALEGAVTAVRDAAHACVTAIGPDRKDDADASNVRKLALAALGEVHDDAVRMLAAVQPPIAERREVVWLSSPPSQAPSLHVAPMEVGGLLRERLFGDRTVVLTSATLTLGGAFDHLARQWGLPVHRKDHPGQTGHPDPRDRPEAVADGESAPASAEPVWRGLDVGSPFDYPRSGILYVARHLPPPGRDGLADAYLTEITELIQAAGGRTLALFSSMRAAKQAAEALRERIEHPLLCQGDDSTGQLVREFAADERTCLFGTLSLWQGVDVPGPALQLVIVDRIPFPRPDDPLASARQRAVAARGGNGFMSVAASHAALLLAQGAGRLLRTTSDRGVVAVLDPRLATARYGGFLRATLPPFWATTDPEVARAALRRLDAAAERVPEAAR
ncbi:ATP-dependent DNA helicase [Allonocardiopsis opalescens]|uniref:ATP-dependent DNA helicase n=1 Tax=Allonocardiopsis opalescens TaxID=1144618 RepID=UPI003CCC3181